MYKVQFKVYDKNNEQIIASGSVLNAKECDKYLKNQLQFINNLKEHSDLQIEIKYIKLDENR